MRRGVSNTSTSELEARANPAREKYNLVPNQLADRIFHEIRLEAQMDYSGDLGHRLEKLSVKNEAGVVGRF